MALDNAVTNPPSEGLRSLSIEAIDNSPEIQGWVGQFDAGDRMLAAQMVRRLRFVSSSVFERWLRQTVASEKREGPTAVFSIDRKPRDNRPYWNDDGTVSDRSGGSHGSEDLIYSLISKLGSDEFGVDDHPSIEEMRAQRSRRILLLDDSIGSGKKAASFLQRFMNHATLRSWWSAGLIHVTVASFARDRAAEHRVLSKVPGNNSRLRKSNTFCSHATLRAQLVFDRGNLKSRWGPSAKDIEALCRRQKGVDRNRRRGFGNVLGNVVFEHSMPNNVPGVFWFRSSNWEPLFPERRLPEWVLRLLEQSPVSVKNGSGVSQQLSGAMSMLIAAIGRGVRTPMALAFALESDTDYAEGLLQNSIMLGLVTPNGRLTDEGRKHWYDSLQEPPKWCRTLYIPTSWRVGP